MKLMEKYGKKKVYIGLATAAAISCVVGVGGTVVYANNKKQGVLNSIYIQFIENPVVEYGSETVDYQSFIENSVGEIILPTETLDTKEVGTKELVYKVSKDGYSKEETVTVEIKDTKAPEITLKEETVTIEVGTEFEPKSNVESVIDPVDGAIEEYEVNSDLDINTVGEYTVNVKATDKNGNATEKSYTVVVEEKEVEKPTVQGNTGYNNGYQPTKPSIPSNSGSVNTGSNNNSSSGGNSSSGLGYYPHQIGNSGKVFSSWAAADEWAYEHIFDKNSPYYMKSYTVMSIGVPGRDYDFWTVGFR